uniref:Uncharacterized protein n=1 Tax=Neobodo designis TaxID=312471 RepID=A0A7S1QE36_NEODS|mmetsp:Transcript_40019/g.123649  ORF Transcript_40019/g.123649 Transcript_40019/m.123649 type:complete len:296 (+) Transcript_40019:35-922(+)|eukprot:CAMPEP_0174850532 /NCGR_PEP_ID=MMETSP1114-20130205/19800_1 /TAXON_ID=312471 /ORGANISM="Neobodo designis, Strain CCAP 1951/1" /LENGTH=295 /DNA_ID=CAMNT_0016084997 /DNA_START=35 /DNA_END=922 /DNA_ORIENTATION=+
MRAFRVACRSATLRAASSTAAAAALGVPKGAEQAASQPYLVWAELNTVARARLAPIAATAASDNTRYAEIRNGMKAPASKPATMKDAISKAKTLADVANGVEATLFEVRRLEKEREDTQLAIWGLNDLINLGLSVSTAEQIEAYKKEKVAAVAKLDANRKAHAAYCAKTFDTATFNDVINMFRIAGETSHTARLYAETLLDDMTMCNVAFDEATKLMMKNVVFGDAPHEDSNLLFTFVENPERGEVSLAPIANGDLTKIADEAVMTIGRRHTTPVTEHVKLQQKDTHPMLQRSSE